MRITNSIIKWLCYPKEERSLFHKEFMDKNSSRLYYSCILISILSLAILVHFYTIFDAKTAKEFSWKTDNSNAHLVLFSVMFSIGLILRILKSRKFNNTRVVTFISHFVFLFVLVMGAVFSAIDQYVTTAINPFMITSMAVPLIVLIPPLFSIVYFLADFILFLFIIPEVQSNPTVILSISTDALTALVIGLLVSIILWHYNIVRFQQSLVIKKQTLELERQNQELHHIADELKQADKSKDKLFSIIAHDLRSPFNAFLGFTELLVEDQKLASSPNHHEIVLAMRSSALNYYRLLENLLDWARIQRKMIVFRPVKIELIPLLIQSVEIVNETAEQKAIKIFVVQKENFEVIADENIVSTILRNLLNNAIKFTSRGGRITIEAKRQDDGIVAVSVADNGVGMSAEMIEKLFKRDEDTGRSGTEGEPSTGLGLLLCKELVERHNGTITAESEPGKGSIFTFTIGKTDEIKQSM